MILSIISALVMSGLALTMLLRAKQARTCRVALLPLAAACMEWLVAGYLSPADFPWLTLLLIALRLTLVAWCTAILRADLARARQKARRQKLARRLEARTIQPMLPASAMPQARVYPYLVA